MRRDLGAVALVATASLAAACGSATGSPPAAEHSTVSSATGTAQSIPTDTAPATDASLGSMSDPSGPPASDPPAVPLPPATPPPTTGAPRATPGPDPGLPPGSIEPALEPAAQRLRAELAAELDIDQAEITVTVAEFVVWGDGSLGCPEPGREYPQVPVDGVRIVLAAAGTTYSYHGGGDVELFLCATPVAPPPGPPPGGDT